jgi:c-di-GMP-binding flagellar brake protein YcgR
MSEKRRYSRISVDLPVILRHGGKLIPATLENISSGGMYLKTGKTQISTDRPVEIIFDLSESNRDVSMRGQVTRIEDADEGSGVGVQFTNLFSLSHKAVQKYVNEKLH